MESSVGKKYLLLALALMLGMANSYQAFADDKGEYLHWDYKIGGEERLRYEFRDNFDLNKSKKDNGSQFLNRFKLNFTDDLVDEYLNKVATVFVEGLDASILVSIAWS